MYNLRGGFLVRPLIIALVLGGAGALLSLLEEGFPVVSGWVPAALFPSHADPQVAQVILAGIAASMMTDRSVYQRPFKTVTIYLRGQLNPSAIPAQVRERVRSIDPELPVFHAVTLDDVLSASLSVRRFSMEMVACFAATALLLAGLGIYGTISYVVNEQRREIAIRLALGATKY